jgi:hypothetical protein
MNLNSILASGREDTGAAGVPQPLKYRPIVGVFSPRCRVLLTALSVGRRGLDRGLPVALQLVGASAPAFLGQGTTGALQFCKSRAHGGRDGDGDAFHDAAFVALAEANRAVVSRRRPRVMSYAAPFLTPEVRHG